jgi:cholesterol transport system auxiliary component
MNARSSCARALPALLSAAFACGCTSFHSDQPATQVYALDPGFAAAAAPATEGAATNPAAATPQPAAASTLQVLRPLAAPGLDTTEIALMRGGQRLDYYAGSRWPGPLPDLVQSLAIEALRAAGKFRSVQPDSSPFPADLVLQLEIRRCQAVYAGDGPPTVQVQLLATLGRRSERAILRTIEAEGSVPAADNRMQPVVAAFQAAVSAALRDLATRVEP